MDEKVTKEFYSREIFVVIETRRKMHSKINVRRWRMTEFQQKVWEDLCDPMIDNEQAMAMYMAASTAAIDYLCNKLKNRKNIDVEKLRSGMKDDLKRNPVRRGDGQGL